MTTIPDRSTFESAYAGQAPWDIGRPQKPFIDVSDSITGSILDAGCGTGDNALFFASIVDFVNRWSDKTGIAVLSFLLWLGLATSKWHSWKHRYGKANEHNAWIPRDHWLEAEEKQAIRDFQALFPLRIDLDHDASLHLFLDCAFVTVLPPGETESGSAGTQPDKG